MHWDSSVFSSQMIPGMNIDCILFVSVYKYKNGADQAQTNRNTLRNAIQFNMGRVLHPINVNILRKCSLLHLTCISPCISVGLRLICAWSAPGLRHIAKLYQIIYSFLYWNHAILKWSMQCILLFLFFTMLSGMNWLHPFGFCPFKPERQFFVKKVKKAQTRRRPSADQAQTNRNTLWNACQIKHTTLPDNI